MPLQSWRHLHPSRAYSNVRNQHLCCHNDGLEALRGIKPTDANGIFYVLNMIPAPWANVFAGAERGGVLVAGVTQEALAY